MVVEVPLPSGEVVRQLANPIKFSGSTLEYRHAGSTPGAHTKEVLRDLGYSGEEIGDFEKSGLFK
jgi:formyl-CoA transferase